MMKNLTIDNKKPKVSVIIAVYKVEPYIERCLHTLFGQTLDEIEYIFVNDATPDRSMQILQNVLEQYPHRKSQVKIINHDVNKGIAAARTSGIIASRGGYIIHCDPDDYVESTMFEEMFNAAKGTASDIVFCNYFIEENNSIIEVNSNIPSSPKRIVSDYYKDILSLHTLWNIMVKSDIIHHYNIVPFEGGNNSEDVGCFVRICYYAETLTHVKRPLYHYCKRKESITMNSSDIIIMEWSSRRIVIDKISEFFNDKKEYRNSCDSIKLYNKFRYIKAFAGKPEEWFNLYRESHSFMIHMKNENWKVRLLWSILLKNEKLFMLLLKYFSPIKDLFSMN